jgi:hypothetical protein
MAKNSSDDQKYLENKKENEDKLREEMKKLENEMKH